MILGLGLGLGPIRTPKPAASDEDEVPRKYLFIDGGFFHRFVEEMKEAARPEIEGAEIELIMVGAGYDRVLFYDAFPERKNNQTEAAFAQSIKEKEEHFDKISRTQNFNVRPALTRGGSRQEQKGVDVLLAIECLLHAVRNNIDEATIMTSDLDFFPLFDALLQTKTKSVLRYQIGKTSPELIRAADYARPMTGADFVEWLTRAHNDIKGGSSIDSQQAASGRQIAKGTVAGKDFQLMQTLDEKWYFALIDGQLHQHARKIRFAVEGELERTMQSRIKYSDA